MTPRRNSLQRSERSEGVRARDPTLAGLTTAPANSSASVKRSACSALIVVAGGRQDTSDPVTESEVDVCVSGKLAGSTGLEPAASAVTGQRSNQLNYDPNDCYFLLADFQRSTFFLVGGTGFEPVTAGV